MKKYILLTVLGLALSFSGLQAQDWLAFQAESCLCKTKFPARPDLKQQQEEGYMSNQAIATYNDVVFLLDFSTLPEPYDKESGKLFSQEAVKAFAASLDARIVKEKKWKKNGWEGLQTKMEIPSEGAIVYYNTLLVRSINYQIAVIGKEENAKKVGKKFVKAFKLL